MADGRRCPDAGVHIDYHADRVGEVATARLLPGPAYTPIDPAFAAYRRDRTGPVRDALVTIGGAHATRRLVGPAIAALRSVFPGVRIHVASGAAEPDAQDVLALPFPSSLLDVIGDIDVAVSAAGLTASELACAGVPSVLVPAASNQLRVTAGFGAAGAALIVEPDAPESSLAIAVARLADPKVRADLADAGPALVDGHGAARVAAALKERWWAHD
jgi:spore coat polysaccharide biosynthesis predicted glycosyltransferase SpsG